MIKVFFTGIAGANKRLFLEDFEKLCNKNKKKCQIISFGEIIFKLAEELGLHLKEEKWLNLPRSTIKTLLVNAIERLEKIINDECDVVIISTHASFWWKNGPEHAFDIPSISKINPDLYITLINDPAVIKKNIDNDPRWGKDFITFKEILLWMDLEIYTTEIFADLQNRKHYILHFDHQPETLFKLIFQPHLPKIYLSYPMTFLKKSDFKRVEKFIADLNKYSIVIDPKLEKFEISLLSKEEQKLLNNHIVKRDYRFIDQSDILIIYYFKLVSSPGVESEKSYAHQVNKFVWLIYPFDKKSPFTSYYSDRIFKKEQEVLNALKRLSSIKKFNQ